MPFWRRDKASKDSSEQPENPTSAVKPRRRLSKPQTNTTASLAGHRASQIPHSRPSLVFKSIEYVPDSSATDDSLDKQDASMSIRSQTLGSVETFQTAGESATGSDLLSPTGSSLPSNDVSRSSSTGSRSTKARRSASRHSLPLSDVSRSSSTGSHPVKARASATKSYSAARASQLSLVAEVSSVDVPTAVSMLQRLSKTASPEELAALRKYDVTALIVTLFMPEAEEVLNPNRSPPISTAEEAQRFEDNVDPENAALIRRRSYATPGVATRNKKRQPLMNPLRCHPVRPEDHDVGRTWYDEDMRDPLPLGCSAGLAATNSGESPQARAQTPCDNAYSHLGSLRLGSLVVTNGAASPEPGDESKRGTKLRKDGFCDDDYYTASEGCATPVGVFSRDLSGSSTPEEGASAAAQDSRASSGTFFQSTSTIRLPKKSENRFEESLSCASWENETSGTGHESQQDLKPATQRQPQRIAKTRSASHFARGYLSELPASPFVEASRLTPERNISRSVSQESKSVYSVQSDEGFVDDAGVETTGGSSGTFAQTVPEINVESLMADNSPSPSPKLEAEEFQIQVKARRPKQQKVDSGYSSATNSTRHPTPPDEKQISSVAVTKEDVQTQPGFGNKVSHPRQERPASSDRPVTKSESFKTFDQMLHQSSPGASDCTDSEPFKSTKSNSKLTRQSLLRSLSWGRRYSHSSVPPLTSSLSVPTISSLTSSATMATPDVKQSKKLQKPRPRHSAPIEFPTLRAIGAVPRVPTPIRTKHSERLNGNPEMDHLERTYTTDYGEDDKQLTVSKGKSLEIRFPSPEPERIVEAIERNSKKKARGSLREAKTEPNSRPSTPPTQRSMVGLFRRSSQKPKGRDSSQQGVADIDSIMADFGTASQSLGGSPYDIAYAMSRTSHQAPSPFYPHQISTNVMRPRSWVGMDDETAAEFARMRSRDRAERAEMIQAAMEAEMQQRRPKMIPRPHSFHESMQPSQITQGRSGNTGTTSQTVRQDFDVPQRSGSDCSDYGRGRPRSFQEWELQRRNSRSRSRPRTLPADMAPPVPPLPVQTFEREEEHEYAPVPARHSSLGAPGVSHRQVMSDTAPEVVASQEGEDWSVSADKWRQRKAQLKQDLAINPAASFETAHSHLEETGDDASTPRQVVSSLPSPDLPQTPRIMVTRATPSPSKGLETGDAYELDGSNDVHEHHELPAHPTTPRQSRSRNDSGGVASATSATSAKPKPVSISSSSSLRADARRAAAPSGRTPGSRTASSPAVTSVRVLVPPRSSSSCENRLGYGSDVSRASRTPQPSTGTRVLKSYNHAQRSAAYSTWRPGTNAQASPAFVPQRVN